MTQEKGKHIFQDAVKWAGIFAIPLALFALLLSWPLPRQVGLSFRYDFSILLPVCILLVFAFRLKNWWGEMVSQGCTLLLFALPLSGLWASGQSEPYLIGGLLPFSDGMGYYNDAQRLLAGLPFSSFSARRPLFPALLSVLLLLTGHNLQLTLAVLLALNALACYLFAREVQKTYGTLAGVFALALLFSFFRLQSGKTMSEELGFALGILGTILFLRSASGKNIALACSGFLLLTLGLNARAGAFFVLPLLVIWGAWYFRGGKLVSVRFVLFSCLSVALGFALNYLLYQTLSADGILFGNFSDTLYGLAAGGQGWGQVVRDHPEILQLSEPERSRTIYRLAFALMRQDPGGILRGALASWRMFFSLDYYSVFCYVGGDSGLEATPARLALYALSLVPLVRAFFRRQVDPHFLLLLFSAAGVLLSVPFAPPLDASRMRAYAVTIPFIILLPGTGAAILLRRVHIKPLQWLEHSPGTFATASLPLPLGAGVVVLTLAGSLLINDTQHHYAYAQSVCPPGLETVYVRLDPGAYIHVTDTLPGGVEWLPHLYTLHFIDNVHNSPHVEGIIGEFERMQIPVTIINGIDLNSGLSLIVFIEPSQLTVDQGVLQICGHRPFEPNYFTETFLYADSVEALQE